MEEDKYSGLSEQQRLMAMGYEDWAEVNLETARESFHMENEALSAGDKYLERLANQ